MCIRDRVGLSGALVGQHQKYADINMGRGAIVIGLAAIVIGEVLMGRLINFACKLSSVVVGAVIYFLIRALVLRVGLETNDMNLFTAVFVAFSLSAVSYTHLDVYKRQCGLCACGGSEAGCLCHRGGRRLRRKNGGPHCKKAVRRISDPLRPASLKLLEKRIPFFQRP